MRLKPGENNSQGGGDGEAHLHLLCQPVDLTLGVAEDDGLRDGQCVVEVAQRVKLPLFSLDSDKELLDAFQSQLITKQNTEDM